MSNNTTIVNGITIMELLKNYNLTEYFNTKEERTNWLESQINDAVNNVILNGITPTEENEELNNNFEEVAKKFVEFLKIMHDNVNITEDSEQSEKIKALLTDKYSELTNLLQKINIAQSGIDGDRKQLKIALFFLNIIQNFDSFFENGFFSFEIPE